MGKKTKKKQQRALKDAEAIARAAVAAFEAVPGAKAVLKPLRKVWKRTGFTRLVTG